MYKKILLLTLCVISLQLAKQPLFAVRAYHSPIRITQPDGSQLSIRLQGDEFHHFQTTEDGYILKKNTLGYYTYATITASGAVAESFIIARDVNKRSPSDVQYLKAINKESALSAILSSPRKSRMLANTTSNPRKAYPLNGSPKALVILANFSDVNYSVASPQSEFQNLLTQVGYNTNGGTGSAKDYFMASTYGKFAPDFVVVGPVKLPQTMAYYGVNDSNGEDTNPAQMILDACNAANTAGLDFTQFDTDVDGYVDNVFVYYAGYNEAESGAENTIWPHRWSVADAGITSGITFDGKKINDYSCTSELKGTTGINMCGIGTFCHEFGHVIGLPDYYDTSGTQSNTLNEWDIMDYGAYSNNGCTPPVYSAYDRFFLGYLAPQQVSEPSDLTLLPLYQGITQPANTDNQAFLFSQTTHNLNGAAPSPAEFFLVEYRKQTGWDTYLPSEGMCIWHIDYLQSQWDANTPNNYTGTSQTKASHMRVYLQPLTGSTATPGDAFSTGSFIPTTWSGTDINRAITNITTATDKITFKLRGGVSVFGPFSALPATNATSTGFTANWNPATNATKYLLNVYKKSTTTGAPVTETTSFNNFPTTKPVGWTTSVTTVYASSGNYGLASPSVKLGVTGATITTAVFSNSISSVSFWIKGQGTDATSSLLIEGSTNGSTWANVQTVSSLPITGTTKTITISTSLGYKALRFTYTKSAGNLAIDDIAITYGGTSTTITKILTDYEVATGTSYSVSGLTADNYYYTVKAANLSDISAESNEIAVLIPTDVITPEQGSTILMPVVGGVLVKTTSDQYLRIYDITGSLVKEQHVTAGITTIPLQSGRVYIIKIASSVRKIVIK